MKIEKKHPMNKMHSTNQIHSNKEMHPLEPTESDTAPSDFHRQRFDSIQALRGVTALFIVLEHIRFLNCGAFGVDIFFCISGFMIMFSTHSDTRYFLRKRLIRILPLYYLMTLGTFLLLLLFPGMFEQSRAEPVFLVKSLLFLPFDIGGGVLQPLMRIGWTVNCEIFFYIVFLAAMKINHKYRGLICGVILLAVVGIAGLLPSPPAFLAFYGNPVMLEFILGFAAYYAAWALYRHRQASGRIPPQCPEAESRKTPSAAQLNGPSRFSPAAGPDSFPNRAANHARHVSSIPEPASTVPEPAANLPRTASNIARPAVCLLGLVVCFTGLILTKPSINILGFRRPLVWGLPALFIVLCAFVLGLNSKSAPAPLVRLGNISFSLYLVHYYPVMLLDRAVFDFSAPTPYALLGAAAALILSITLAIISYLLIEKRFSGWVRRRLLR